MVKTFDKNAQRMKRHTRVRGKISGTPERPRLNVYRSNANIYAQIIDDVSGVTLAAAASNEKDFEGATGNKEAARYSGINVKRVEIFVYTLSGLLAAFSGIIYAARMASGQPAVAIGFETDAISAVVVGGVSMTGGVGTLGGVILGSLLIGIISNGLNLIRVSSFWQYVVKGIIILIAVYMDMYRKRKERF